MTEDLQKLAETKFEFNVAKKLMLERVDAHSTFTFAGGLFKANAVLLAIIVGLTEPFEHFPTTVSGRYVVLLDSFDNPIRVNLVEFRTAALEANQYAMNAYLEEYTKLKKVRNGGQL